MFLSWLSKFFASLLVSLLFSITVGVVMSQTVLSSHYIDNQLQQTHAYPKLSDAISKQIVKDAHNTQVPTTELTAQVKTIITPEVLQQKLTSTLNQLEAYYKGNGPAPTVDVSDLIAKAQAAGVPTPKDSNLAKPIQLKAASNAKNVSDKVAAVKLVTMAAIIVLALSLLAIAFHRHKYAPLANVFISLGVLLSLMGSVLLFAPGIVDSYAKLNYATNAFAGIAHDLAASIAHDIGKRLVIIGLVSLIGGIIARILLHKFAKSAQLDSKSLAEAPNVHNTSEPATNATPTSTTPTNDEINKPSAHTT